MRDPAVYITANRRNGTLYVGVTSDLPLRAHQHREGLTPGFTRRYGCKMLVYYEKYKDMDSAIGREKIQSFVGALSGKHASKGVFITTSRFADTAISFASGVPQKVILIDGERLAELMIEHNVGVTTRQLLKIKQIDTDYFEDL